MSVGISVVTKPPLDPEDIGLKLSRSNLVFVSFKTCGPWVIETVHSFTSLHGNSHT